MVERSREQREHGRLGSSLDAGPAGRGDCKATALTTGSKHDGGTGKPVGLSASKPGRCVSRAKSSKRSSPSQLLDHPSSGHQQDIQDESQ